MDKLSNLAAVCTVMGTPFLILEWVRITQTKDSKPSFLAYIGVALYAPFFIVLILTLTYQFIIAPFYAPKAVGECLPDDSQCQEYYGDLKEIPY